MLTSEMAEIIIALYNLSGGDHNNGFYGRGKKAIIEKAMKSSEAKQLLKHCGDVLPIPTHVLDNLKKFVIKFIYGSQEEGCAETRAKQWKKMKKKNTQRLMPDEDTLNHICARANYLSYCQKNFKLMQHPSPIGHGWEIINSKCRPVRYTLPPLPAEITGTNELCPDDTNDDSGSDTDTAPTHDTDTTDTDED